MSSLRVSLQPKKKKFCYILYSGKGQCLSKCGTFIYKTFKLYDPTMLFHVKIVLVVPFASCT
jgi:hypothetical protein